VQSTFYKECIDLKFAVHQEETAKANLSHFVSCIIPRPIDTPVDSKGFECYFDADWAP